MTGGAALLAALPAMGAGLGYRRAIRGPIMESRDAIDFIEIVTDSFTGDAARLRELAELCELYPVIAHGVGLSIGSASLDDEYVREIKRVSAVTGTPYYSEHLAITRAPGIDLGHLAPVWFTEESLELVTRNVRRVQDELEKPLVLENITYPFEIPYATMSQPEFFGRLVEATGCGILLDVENVHVNAVNHGFDPSAFMRAMPLASVVGVHLAGGYWDEGRLIDGHSEPVGEETWTLLAELAARIPVRAATLEQDADFPADFAVLLDQLARARAIVAKAV